MYYLQSIYNQLFLISCDDVRHLHPLLSRITRIANEMIARAQLPLRITNQVS